MKLNTFKKRHLSFIGTIVFVILFLLTSCQKSEELNVDINWLKFMAQHDLIWEELPMRWENAPFNGNGLAGSMLYMSPDSSRLKLSLGRSDIGKLDYPGHFRDPNRIQLGSIDLKTNGKILLDQSTLRLDLWNAQITGDIKTTQGAFKIRSFVVKDEPLLVVEKFDTKGKEKQTTWVTDFQNTGEYFKMDDIHFFEVQDTVHHPRSQVKSGGHVIAWKQNQTNNTNQLFVSINASPSTHSIWNQNKRAQSSAVQNALETLSVVKIKTISDLFEEQANWWHQFYPKSFISFGNKELESYYWIQLYKMASSSRKGYPMIDNHGIWSVEPVYGFATWDLNVQIIYRLHMAANHLELGEPLNRFLETNFNPKSMYIDSLKEMRAGLRQQTFLRYKYFDTNHWEHDKKSPNDGPAKFLWGTHNYWLHFQYTQDSLMLPKLRDMLEGGVNAMKAGMEKEGDGKWHVPYGHSWETWRGKNPNGHLAVLKWALETLIAIEPNAQKRMEWQKFYADITDYVVGKNGYMLGEGKEVKPHRHWSHLLHLFPLRTELYEEDKELYMKSVNAWADLSTGIKDGVSKSGYAPSGAINLYAQAGQTERIDSLINVFLYGKSSRGPNVWGSTMYREFGPVIETPLFFAASLQELVLQSKENQVKVFPAVPKSLGDVVFHKYRAEGGFEISARLVEGKVAFVKIKSLTGNTMNLQADINHLEIKGNAQHVKSFKRNYFELSLGKNETIILYNSQLKKYLAVESLDKESGEFNSFGLNQRFYENRSYLKE